MKASPPLLYGVVAASVLSLALSVYAAFGRKPATALPASGASNATACACDDAALHRELADLKRALATRGDDARVRRLAARVEALEAKAGVPPPASVDGAGDPGPAPAASTATAAAAPVLTSFAVPSPAIRVRQEPGGGLAVTNTDPAMTGKHLVFKATAADGSTHDVHIIVPAPAQ